MGIIQPGSTQPITAEERAILEDGSAFGTDEYYAALLRVWDSSCKWCDAPIGLPEHPAQHVNDLQQRLCLGCAEKNASKHPC